MTSSSRVPPKNLRSRGNGRGRFPDSRKRGRHEEGLRESQNGNKLRDNRSSSRGGGRPRSYSMGRDGSRDSRVDASPQDRRGSGLYGNSSRGGDRGRRGRGGFFSGDSRTPHRNFTDSVGKGNTKGASQRPKAHHGSQKPFDRPHNDRRDNSANRATTGGGKAVSNTEKGEPSVGESRDLRSNRPKDFKKLNGLTSTKCGGSSLKGNKRLRETSGPMLTKKIRGETISKSESVGHTI